MTERRRRTREPGEGIRSNTVPAFQPSPAQLKYLAALEEALTRREPTSDSAICGGIGISRMTLWKWRQLPGFSAWVQGRLDQTSDWHWPLILQRHELQAIQGSVKSAEFIWKVRSGVHSRARGIGAEANPATGYSVNILVPRPDVDACPDL